MKPKKIIIHHSAANDNFAVINSWHKHRWEFKSELGYYAGYQYVIERTGEVFQARKDTEEGAHTKGENLDSIGICLCGNLNSERPTLRQLVALKSLVNRKMIEHVIPSTEVYGHRHFSRTQCPGDNITDLELKELFVPSVSYIQALITQLASLIASLRLKIALKMGYEADAEDRD